MALTLLAVLAAAWPLSPARAQAFAGVPNLDERLSAIRAAAQRVAGGLGHSSAALPAPEDLSQKPDVSRYPVRGMDISHYQHAVEWDRVKGRGLSFVYIKATDGEELQDERFRANWDGASQAGLLKGAYHFYDFCSGGLAQAANFIRTVPKERRALPPAIDLERSAECRDLPAKKDFLREFAAFLDAVEGAYGVQPILYIEGAIYARYMDGVAEPYALWYSDIHHASAQTPSGRAWTLWQYSWRGSVPGIDTDVDLDVFNGDRAALSRLASGGETLLVRRD